MKLNGFANQGQRLGTGLRGDDRDRHGSRFSRMVKLLVASFRPSKNPAVGFDQSDQVADLHQKSLPSSSSRLARVPVRRRGHFSSTW